MKRANVTHLVSILLILLLALPAAAKRKQKDAKKEYSAAMMPAEKKVNLEEGTIEAWVSLAYSHDTVMNVNQSHLAPMIFFGLDIQKDDSKSKSRKSDDENPVVISLHTFQGMGGVNTLRFRTNLGITPRKEQVIPGSVCFPLKDFNWQKDDWHHVAVTWKKNGDNYDLSLYVDGKGETKSYQARADLPKSLKDYVIRIGGITSAEGAVEALKVSPKAKSEEEIKSIAGKEIKEDKDTLYFFNAKVASRMKKKSNSPSVLKKLRLSSKGVFLGPCKTTKGEHGKAVSFCN